VNMAVYWISFRIESNSTYEARLGALNVAIKKCGAAWAETTSFFLVSTDLGIASVAAACDRALDPRSDVVIIGEIEIGSEALTVGRVEQMPLAFIPGVRVYQRGVALQSLIT
ncbi:MAG: hypothetical protein ABI650_00215, partial [Dokdonella sp.]